MTMFSLLNRLGLQPGPGAYLRLQPLQSPKLKPDLDVDYGNNLSLLTSKIQGRPSKHKEDHCDTH